MRDPRCMCGADDCHFCHPEAFAWRTDPDTGRGQWVFLGDEPDDDEQNAPSQPD